MEASRKQRFLAACSLLLVFTCCWSLTAASNADADADNDWQSAYSEHLDNENYDIENLQYDAADSGGLPSEAELEWDAYDVGWQPSDTISDQTSDSSDLTRIRRQVTVRTLAVTNVRVNVTLAATQRVSVTGTDSVTRSVRLNPVPSSISLPDYALVFNESSTTGVDPTRIQIDLAASNLISPSAQYTNESVTIVFSTTQTDGLIWAYSEPSGYKSAVFLKAGKLCVASIDMLVNGRVTTVEKVISGDQFTNGFSSGFPVLVRVTATRPASSGSLVQIDIGDQSVLLYNFRSGLRLFGSGTVYVGAAPSSLVSELTFGEVTERFVGTLYLVLAQRDSRLLNMSNELRYRSASANYVTQNGPNAYWITVTQMGQNASSEDGGLSNTLDLSSPNPVTFYGQSAAYRILSRFETEWSYFDLNMPIGSQSVLEFGLVSFDERGVVLFKGAMQGARSYFCIELFDGYLYLVYNFASGSDRSARVQVCSYRIADRLRSTMSRRRGEFYYPPVNITMRSRREQSDFVRFSVQCENEREIVLNISSYSEVQKFGGYLYVGGLDSETRLPWYVWSRVFFNGAVNFLRINGKYVSYESYFGQHSMVGALLGRIDVTDYCSSRSTCVQNETGICRVDRPRIPGRTNVTCDCAHMNRSALTCDPGAMTFKYDGTFYELVLTPTWVTHVEDISISFNTTQRWNSSSIPPAGPSGLRGGVLFRLMSESSWNDLQRLKFLEVRVLNGELHIALLVDNIPAKQDGTRLRINLYNTTKVRLNDANWHTFRYARRGQQVAFYIDGVNVRSASLTGQGYQMTTKYIGVGCATTGEFTCEAYSYFIGQIRNFVYNRFDVLRTLETVIASGVQQEELVIRGDEMAVNVAIHTIDIDRTGLPGSGDSSSQTNISISNVINTLGNAVALVGHSSSLLEIPLRRYVSPNDAGVIEMTSLNFGFRTSLTNCLLAYQRPTPVSAAEYRSVYQQQYFKFELINGILRFGIRFPLADSSNSVGVPSSSSSSNNNDDSYLYEDDSKVRVRRAATDGRYFFAEYDFNLVGLVSDSQEHLVSMLITTTRLSVDVDRRDVFTMDLYALSNSPLTGLPRTLFYDAVMYLGGLPTPDMWLAAETAGHIAQQYVEPTSLLPGSRLTVRQSAYFRGCLYGLSVHGAQIDFDALSQSHADVGRDWVLKKGCSDDFVLRCSPDLQCANQGRCIQDSPAVHARCDCIGTGYDGLRCRSQPRGYYISPNGLYGGVSVGFVEPPDTTVVINDQQQAADVLIFGLLATYPGGTFLRIIIGTGKSPQVLLRAGKTQQTLTLSLLPECAPVASSAVSQCTCGFLIEYAGDFTDRPAVYSIPSSQLGVSACDGRYHVWRLVATGNDLFVSHIDSEAAAGTQRRTLGPFTMPNLGRFFSSVGYTVLLGTDQLPNSTRPFTGIIGGLAWNNVDVLSRGRVVPSGDARVAENPYRLVEVPCPSLFRPLSTCPDAPISGGGGGGGDGDGGNTGNGGTGGGGLRPTVSPNGRVDGRGGSIVDTVQVAGLEVGETGDGVKYAGMVTAFAIIAGIIMFISALIWAFYMCKPGACCPASGTATSHAATDGVPLVAATSTQTATSDAATDYDIPTRVGGTLKAAPPGDEATEEDIIVASKVDKQRSAAPQLQPQPQPQTTDEQFEDQFVSNSRNGISAGTHFENDIGVRNGGGGFAAASLSVPGGGLRSATSAMYLGTDRYATNGRYQASASSDMLGAPRGILHSQSAFQSSYRLDERAGLHRGMVQDGAGGAFSIPDDAKVSCFVLAGSSQYVITGSSCGAPSFWELKNGDLVRTLDGDESLTSAYGLHLACNDRILVGEISTMTDETTLHMRRLQLWDTQTGRMIEMPLIVYCNTACMLHNDTEIACAAIEPGANVQLNLLVWDIPRNEVVRQYAYPLGNALAQCGLQVDTSGRWRVQLFSAPFDDSALVVAVEPSSDAALNAVRNEPTLLVSCDRSMLAGASHDEPPATAVDCAADCVLLTPFGTLIVGSRRGELLVFATRTLAFIGAVNCASTSRGSTIRSASLMNAVTCLAASTDRRLIASGHGSSISSPFAVASVDNADRPATDWNAVRVWQIDSANPTPACVHVLVGHNDDVTSIAFARDGDCLVSGSRDGSIRMWRLRDGSQMCWFASNISVMSVQMAPNQMAIIAIGDQLSHRKLIMLQIVRSRVKRTQPIKN